MVEFARVEIFHVLLLKESFGNIENCNKECLWKHLKERFCIIAYYDILKQSLETILIKVNLHVLKTESDIELVIPLGHGSTALNHSTRIKIGI